MSGIGHGVAMRYGVGSLSLAVSAPVDAHPESKLIELTVKTDKVRIFMSVHLVEPGDRIGTQRAL